MADAMVPIGITGKLWRKVSNEEAVEWQRLVDMGHSLREVERMTGRDHSTIQRHVVIPDGRPKRTRPSRPKKPQARTFSLVMFRALSMARRRSLKKGLPMDINMSFIKELFDKQRGRCAVTEIPMSLDRAFDGLHQPYAPSIDRIDPLKGYTKDNVRLTVWIVNHAMGEWGEEYFAKIAKAYIDKHAGSDS